MTYLEQDFHIYFDVFVLPGRNYVAKSTKQYNTFYIRTLIVILKKNIHKLVIDTLDRNLSHVKSQRQPGNVLFSKLSQASC